MKKFSIVLLALLLAGGFAFAAEHATELSIDGEASSRLLMDFENERYGMVYDTTNDFSLTFSGSASSEGEGDLYGVISITDAELAFAYSDITAGDETGWSASLGDLEAKIVAENWTAIFGSPTSIGSAASPDMDQDGDAGDFDAVSGALTRGQGLTIELSDLTLGVDFMYDAATAPDFQYLAYASFSTDLTDGVSADVTAAVNDNNVYGSAATSFAVSDLTLGVALDAAYVNTFDFDASVSADYAMGDMSFYTEAYYGDEDVDLLAKTSYAVEGEYSLSVWGYLSQVLTAGAFRGDAADEWGVNLDATYVINDIYDVYASTGFNASQTIPFTVGLNAALIDNAEVNAEYVSDDVSDFANNKGALTTSVTVSL